MRDFFLERQLRRIERDVNDDLLMVLEVGPQYYTNRELYALTERLRRQELHYLTLQRYFYLVLLTIPCWIGLFFLANAFGSHSLARYLLCGVPVAIVVFFAGSAYIRHRFRNCRYANLIRSIIQQELERRRKDASIS